MSSPRDRESASHRSAQSSDRESCQRSLEAQRAHGGITGVLPGRPLYLHGCKPEVIAFAARGVTFEMRTFIHEASHFISGGALSISG